jgi:hypothetical protein
MTAISGAIESTGSATLRSAALVRELLVAAGWNVSENHARTGSHYLLASRADQSVEIRIANHPKPGYDRMRCRANCIESYPMSETGWRKRLRRLLCSEPRKD